MILLENMELLQVTSKRIEELTGNKEINLDQLAVELENSIRLTITNLSSNEDFDLGIFDGMELVDEDVEYLVNFWMKKELEFINLVLERVISWCSDDDNQLILFDVDNTISDAHNGIFVIRPSAAILLQLIKTIFPGITFGIMTNNPQEALDGFLNGSDRFGYSLVPISNYFDRSRCYGVRSWFDKENIKMVQDPDDKKPRLASLRAQSQSGIHLVDDHDYKDDQSLYLGDNKFDLEFYAYGEE